MLESLFNKFAGRNIVTKRLQHICFPSKFCEIFKSTFFYRTPLMAASIPKLTVAQIFWLSQIRPLFQPTSEFFVRLIKHLFFNQYSYIHNIWYLLLIISNIWMTDYLLDTRHKLNVHKTFRRRPGHLLNVLCTFNLCLVSRGQLLSW